MTAESAATARRNSRSSSPRSLISPGVLGNSQSRSTPSKPKVRAASMVEAMKEAREEAREAMRGKGLELGPAPPMERRVVTGGVLVRRVVVKDVSDVAVEGGMCSSLVRLLGARNA